MHTLVSLRQCVTVLLFLSLFPYVSNIIAKNTHFKFEAAFNFFNKNFK